MLELRSLFAPPRPRPPSQRRRRELGADSSSVLPFLTSAWLNPSLHAIRIGETLTRRRQRRRRWFYLTHLTVLCFWFVLGWMNGFGCLIVSVGRGWWIEVPRFWLFLWRLEVDGRVRDSDDDFCIQECIGYEGGVGYRLVRSRTKFILCVNMRYRWIVREQ